MHDLLIDGHADVARKLAIAEEGARGSEFLDFCRGKAVDLGGGRTGMNLRGGFDQDITGDLAGPPYALLLRAVADGNVSPI
jgi:hypothetical protein